MAKRDPRDDYRDNTGHDPNNLPDDHPDRWQWEYQGTKAEREDLLERMELAPEEPASQEETLF